MLPDLAYSARHPWARAGLCAALAAAVALAAALAAWWPLQNEHRALEEEISAQRRALARARESEELARAYRQAEKDAASLERKLQHGATQAQLVQGFARLARRHGVKIVSETYEEGRNAAAQPALNAELAVEAGYPALRDFVRELSALPTWSEVQEVRIESAPGGAAQRGRIRIVTYRLAPPAAAKSS